MRVLREDCRETRRLGGLWADSDRGIRDHSTVGWKGVIADAAVSYITRSLVVTQNRAPKPND